MPTDLAYPFSIDETGDADTVSGTDFYTQHAGILGSEAVADISGQPLTANTRTEIESQLERTYRNSPYFADSVGVTIESSTDETISLSVSLGVPVETVTIERQ